MPTGNITKFLTLCKSTAYYWKVWVQGGGKKTISNGLKIEQEVIEALKKKNFKKLPKLIAKHQSPEVQYLIISTILESTGPDCKVALSACLDSSKFCLRSKDIASLYTHIFSQEDLEVVSVLDEKFNHLSQTPLSYFVYKCQEYNNERLLEHIFKIDSRPISDYLNMLFKESKLMVKESSLLSPAQYALLIDNLGKKYTSKDLLQNSTSSLNSMGIFIAQSMILGPTEQFKHIAQVLVNTFPQAYTSLCTCAVLFAPEEKAYAIQNANTYFKKLDTIDIYDKLSVNFTSCLAYMHSMANPKDLCTPDYFSLLEQNLLTKEYLALKSLIEKQNLGSIIDDCGIPGKVKTHKI